MLAKVCRDRNDRLYRYVALARLWGYFSGPPQEIQGIELQPSKDERRDSGSSVFEASHLVGGAF